MLGLASGVAAAATTTGSFTVNVLVSATCAISANPMIFPPYTGTVGTATTTLLITCTNTTPYTVSLNAGLAPGATAASRKMQAGSVSMAYALFSNSARTLNWGQTVCTDTVVGTGNGTAGRPVVVNMPFYASAALLSPAITIEGSVQASAGVTSGGGGLVVNIADLAIMNLAVAASTGLGRTGMQYCAGVQRVGTVFNLGVSATAASRNFQDIATVNGDPVPRLQLSANAGVSLGRFGSIGVAYSAIDRDVAPAPIQVFIPPGTGLVDTGLLAGGFISFQPVQPAHVLSASYSVQLGDVSLYATGFRDFAKGGGTRILFGMTTPLGGRSSAGVSAGAGAGGRYGQIQIAQSAASVGDLGYQAYLARGNVNHEFAELTYKTPWALVTVGADRIDRQTSLRAQVLGAVSFVDGALLPSNTITDSFAVVDTGGLANVRVLNENRGAGTTDYAGRLLVPDLRAFQRNRIDIEANDVPIDVTIDLATRGVWPQDRSGVVVRFGMKISNGALLRLVDAAGSVLPVGYDGRAYVVDLGAHNDVAVERPDGQRAVWCSTTKPSQVRSRSLDP